jgi:HAD superfamily hydrolase (TIGR01490 family)
MAMRLPNRRRATATSGPVTEPAPGWAAAEVEAALSIPADPTAAAFFDVDNTMMQGASIYYMARGMVARNYFTGRDLLRFGWKQLRFRLMAAEHHGDMSTAKQLALAFVEGWRVDDLQRLCEEIFEERMADRIWDGTRALAQQHLDNGERVWLVTAAPIELARIIAARIGLTGALGTVAEVVGGVYTGHLVGDLLHGPAKADAVRALAEVEGLELRRCAAYSDSINDEPMLSAVGHAVAVNPDAALRRTARQRGWQVRDFRTARKAARIAVPAAVLVAAGGGLIAVGAALHRGRRRNC